MSLTRSFTFALKRIQSFFMDSFFLFQVTALLVTNRPVVGWLPLTFTYTLIVAINWARLTRCCFKSRKVVSMFGILALTNCLLTIILPHFHFMGTSIACVAGLIFGFLLKKFDRSQNQVANDKFLNLNSNANSTKTSDPNLESASPPTINSNPNNAMTSKKVKNNRNKNNGNSINGRNNSSMNNSNSASNTTDSPRNRSMTMSKRFYITLVAIALASACSSMVILLLQTFNTGLISRTIEKGLYNLDCIWSFNLAPWCHV